MDIMFVNEEDVCEDERGISRSGGARYPVANPLGGTFDCAEVTCLEKYKFAPELKDLLDVASLVEANHIDLNGEVFKNLCERYGTPKICAQIIAISSK